MSIGARLVMKEISLSDKTRATAEVEVKVLSNMKHPYIVKYWESFCNDQLLCIVMDYCEGGDLSQYIAKCRRQRSPIPENQVVRWFTQMCLALKYMHEKNILHRDIKPQNVFLTKKGNSELPCAKIADFGIAKVLKDAQTLAQSLVGTPYYFSPEICQKQPYACPSDVWAVGCVLYELCALKVPFEAQNLNQLVEQIVRGHLPRIPPIYSQDLAEQVGDFFTRDVNQRPTAAALVQRSLIQYEIKQMLAETTKNRGNTDEVGAEGNHNRKEHREGSGHSKSSSRGEYFNQGWPLVEHNVREHSRNQTPIKHQSPIRASVRAASPHKGAAIEVLKSSRMATPRWQR